ncbi:DUF305 domain-containing protein [Amycolatopsis sacchari]|uniref:DUF305 domain-containing protein n=1 Tax=Amycolatopsis sacchari TaxID=115433 RepID=UPI003EBB30A4
MRRGLWAALLGLAVLALTGCAMGESAPAAEAPLANQADIHFSQQMIPHHQQSIQVAELAAQRATSEFVKSTAEEIRTQETAEVGTMSGWLRSWKAEVPSMSGHSGHSMEGMLTEDQIAALSAASGPEFDRLWLTTMAQHLGNGVRMATAVLASGQHTETRALAQNIVTEQNAQIAAINGQLSG